MSDATVTQPTFFASRPRLLTATLAALFVLATAIRFIQPDAPGVLLDRDYTSAMFARHFYFQHRADLPAWRRDMAAKLVERQPILEPPITEWLVSLAYRVTGREDLRLARLMTVVFWLSGGWLLFLLARRLVGDDAGVVALAYYLFLPLSVVLSRSFQADALMMLLFIAGLLSIVRHHQSPGRWTLVTAAVVSSLALVYRPLVMPAIVFAYVLPVMQSAGWRQALFNRSTLLFLAVATVPAFAYYGYGSFVARYFQWKLTTSFMFSLYGHAEFWREWFLVAIAELGLPALVLACFGVAFLRPGYPRTFVFALALGYAVFGLAFTYHIHTHGYYQAQLIPAIGLAASPVIVFLVRQAFATPVRWIQAGAVLAGFLVAGSWWIEIRQRLNLRQFEGPDVATAIGEKVAHSDKVVFLSPFYGLPLQYVGEFTGAYWPRASTYYLYRPAGEQPKSLRERWDALGFSPSISSSLSSGSTKTTTRTCVSSSSPDARRWRSSRHTASTRSARHHHHDGANGLR